MKYITTDTHPELKEGLILDHSLIERAAGDDLTDDYATPGGWVRFDIHHIKEMINRGYIKEVEGKEFTKSDMIEFGEFCQGNLLLSSQYFNEYSKNK